MHLGPKETQAQQGYLDLFTGRVTGMLTADIGSFSEDPSDDEMKKRLVNIFQQQVQQQ